MKAKIILGFLVVAALAAAAGWFAAKRGEPVPSTAVGTGRKALFYQSPMHPWIKSDKPGKCTICGMDLVPVYEGEKPIDVSESTVVLSSNSINVIHVQTSEVKKQTLRRTMNVAGTIEDNDSRHRLLSSYVDGRIDKLFVNFVGAEVTEGQPLATIYSTSLLNAQREYVSLSKRISGEPASELKKISEDLLKSAAQRLRQMGLSETQIKELPEKPDTDIHTSVLAPMSGTVVARNVYEGQYVKEGDKLFEIADFSTMWFLFDAYERDLNWLRAGQKVEISTPSVSGKKFEGTISFIDPNIKDMTRSAKVRVELANPIVESGGTKRRELYHKLYAQGVVQIDSPEVITVPRSAVLAPGSQTVVYVAKEGGAYERRPVKLGRSGDESWEILEGVSPGERVVTTGNMLIDAQAQLNASGHGNEDMLPDETAGTNKVASLTPEQQQEVRHALESADKLGQALAMDSVEAFRAESAKLAPVLPRVKASLAGAPVWAALGEKLEATGHFPEAPDLAAARKVFLPFSMAAVELARKARGQVKEFGSVKIFQCPMVNQAVPGAPKKGLWVQAAGPLRNPFFGAEMLDCGSEVK
ncbi:MAG TPA: efflux RND transporter periplasmic adaptor subunit [Candidatus Saccharimonadales bacterium]|nr:efflux RND transporter periplasmic adaptor subunit [Candidatus Saccharimonadales bacterium]